MEEKQKALRALRTIPGIGKTMAIDLWNLGIRSIADLKDQDAEALYILHNDLRKKVQDICVLYTFRCAVYFANTQGKKQDPEKLKWWHWVDAEKTNSISKDAQIRKKLGV